MSIFFPTTVLFLNFLLSSCISFENIQNLPRVFSLNKENLPSWQLHYNLLLFHVKKNIVNTLELYFKIVAQKQVCSIRLKYLEPRKGHTYLNLPHIRHWRITLNIWQFSSLICVYSSLHERMNDNYLKIGNALNIKCLVVQITLKVLH